MKKYTKYGYEFKIKNIDYEIIIVDQDSARQFNRGMLLNIGFKYAEQNE